MKLTGAAILVSRGMKVLQATPEGELGRSCWLRLLLWRGDEIQSVRAQVMIE